ncbi:DUF2868 domain-containing protein [Desulfomarina sp.]
MRRRWKYQDIIDLEYLLHEDAKMASKQLHKRDRDIYLQNFAENTQKTVKDEELIACWLTERLKQEFPEKPAWPDSMARPQKTSENPDCGDTTLSREFSDTESRSPGKLFSDAHLLTRILVLVFGIVSGTGAGLSFFHYSGTTPINVFQFLLFFIFSQILLTCLLISSLFIRKIRSKNMLPSFYRFFFSRLLKKGADLLSRQWRRHLPGKKRLSFSHALGIVASRGKLYGSLFYWPFFNLAQIFALSFNGGLLGATLLKIGTNDLAFGWQSTLQFSALSLHKLISFMALPWSWFIPESLAFPSLGQIEGSRIVLKEGIYMLATENLVSWWPFLVFSLVFYGLFFRLLLYIIGKIMEKRALNRYQCRSAACRRTVQRMTTPLFSTQARPEQEKPVEKSVQSVSPASSERNRTFPQTVLVADDIAPLFPESKIRTLLQQHGFTPQQISVFMTDYDTDREIIQELAEKNRDSQTGLFLIMEGWMVPLTDFLTWLRELRRSLRRETIITVGLVGRPSGTDFFPVTESEYAIWLKKINGLGDPFLQLLALNPEKEK